MQGADGFQRRLVKNALATALLDAGGGHPALLIDDQEDQRFAFQPLGDGFGRIEEALFILFLELSANFVQPRRDDCF